MECIIPNTKYLIYFELYITKYFFYIFIVYEIHLLYNELYVLKYIIFGFFLNIFILYLN